MYENSIIWRCSKQRNCSHRPSHLMKSASNYTCWSQGIPTKINEHFGFIVKNFEIIVRMVLNDLNTHSTHCSWYNISNVPWLPFWTIFTTVLYKPSDNLCKPNPFFSILSLLFSLDFLNFYCFKRNWKLIFFGEICQKVHHHMLKKNNLFFSFEMKGWLDLCRLYALLKAIWFMIYTECIHIINSGDF